MLLGGVDLVGIVAAGAWEGMVRSGMNGDSEEDTSSTVGLDVQASVMERTAGDYTVVVLAYCIAEHTNPGWFARELVAWQRYSSSRQIIGN